MRFVDLLLPPKSSPIEQQRAASKDFGTTVTASHLHLWSPGDPIRLEGRRLLVGVSPSYAVPDLELLDCLEAALSRGGKKTWVDVFDLDTCHSQSEIQPFFPGIKVLQTPVLGIWSAGNLTEVIQGSYARERIARMIPDL